MTALSLVVVGLALAAPVAAQANLNGAGATFPNPIYTKWFDRYAKKTGVKINYQSIGSGGGIRQFTQGTVDFGASDSPMTDEQIAAVKGNVAHIPTVLGAVVLIYNLPAVGTTKLKLDINKLNDRKTALFNEIGRQAYALRAQGRGLAEVEAQCTEVDGIDKEIKRIGDEIVKINTEPSREPPKTV